MKTCFLLLIMCLFAMPGKAEDVDKYIDAATSYIVKHGTTKDKESFEKKWKSMVETADTDSGETEEKFLNRYIFDWMADRKGRFEKNALTVSDKLQACRLYLIYKNLNEDRTLRRKGANDSEFAIPSTIAKYLTVENLDKFVAEEKNPSKTVNSATK